MNVSAIVERRQLSGRGRGCSVWLSTDDTVALVITGDKPLLRLDSYSTIPLLGTVLMAFCSSFTSVGGGGKLPWQLRSLRLETTKLSLVCVLI